MAKTFLDFVYEVSKPKHGNLLRKFCKCDKKIEIKMLLDWGLNPPDPLDPELGYWDGHGHVAPNPDHPDDYTKGVSDEICGKLVEIRKNTGLIDWPPPPSY